MLTTGVTFKKPASTNMPNQSYCVIRTTLFPQFISDPKNIGSLELEFKNQHYRWTWHSRFHYRSPTEPDTTNLRCVPPFRLSYTLDIWFFCGGIGDFWSCLSWKWLLFTCLLRSGGGRGGERQRAMYIHTWWVTSRYFTYIIID